MGYQTIDSHRPMALDRVRNQAYAEALGRSVGPDTVVLDLGAGLGVFGLLAADRGAKRVYCVEPEEVVELSRELAVRSGLGDRVQCVHGRLEEIEIPERVDVIVSALTGNMLFTEDLLPTLFHARDRYLKPGGCLIPDAASVNLVPVSAPDLHARRIGVWSEPHLGIDLSPARPYAANSVYYLRSAELSDASYLAAATELLRLDFHDGGYEPLDRSVDFAITSPGLCHGVVGWFDMRLADRWFSTGPSGPETHWSSVFFPLDPPLEVAEGESVGFRLERPPYGEWTWTVESGASRQRRTTLKSLPFTPRTLTEMNPTYVPELSDEGRAVLRGLSLIDGVRSRSDLAEVLSREFPNLFPEPRHASELVGRLLGEFCRGGRISSLLH